MWQPASLSSLTLFWRQAVQRSTLFKFAVSRGPRGFFVTVLDSSWNAMAHGDAREGKWRGKWRMERVASTLHTTSEHGVSIITTADAHASAVSSRLNWRPRQFKWTRPFRRKTKSGFCACAITFQLACTTQYTYYVAADRNCCKWWKCYTFMTNKLHLL